MLNLKSNRINPLVLAFIWFSLIPYFIFAFDKSVFFYFFSSNSLAGIGSVLFSISGPIIFLSHLVINGSFIKKQNHKILLVFCLFLFTLGSTFLILHFPGADFLLLGACIFPIIAYTLISLKKTEKLLMDYLKISYVLFFFLTRLFIFLKQGEWIFYFNMGEQISLVLLLIYYTKKHMQLSR